MTVKDLMEMVDRLHPNQFSTADKLAWLNQVEQTIFHDVIMTHRDAPVDVAPVYDDITSTEELLAEDPWSRLYPLWMNAQIAYYNHESMQYDTAAQAFNSAYDDYWRAYNRAHLPVGRVNHLHLTDRRWGYGAADL